MPAYSFQRRFVDPIKVGLGLPYEPILGLQPAIMRPKLQTIRAIGKRRHARPGDIVQLYHGMRTKQCFKIGEGLCVGVHTIELSYAKIEIDRGEVDWKEIRTLGGLNEFAQSDGFAHWREMQQFWREEHGDEFATRPFKGVLIRWEPLS